MRSTVRLTMRLTISKPKNRPRVCAFAAMSALASALLLSTASEALAQSRTPAGPGGFPVKPVRLVISGVPGGTTDIVARLIAPRWGEEIGQTIVIDNRAGAAGLIARDIVARAPGDGYTLLMINQSIVFAAATQPKAASDIARDFAAIGQIGVSPNLLVANPSLAAKSITELIALSKTRQLSYASGGVGSSTHVAMEMFLRAASTQALHVPYKSAGAGIVEVVAGHVQFMITTLPAALGYVRNGKLRALALTDAHRSPALPEMPTVAEAGIRGYSFDTWYGVFGPVALPPLLVNWLNAAINRTVADTRVREKLVETGLDPGTGTPAAFQRLFREDVARWTRAIKEAGIKPE